MKTVLYSLTTPAGTFWMQPQPAGRVLLGIDNHHLKTYPSPTAAAADVRARSTGWSAWDELTEPLPPHSLRQWRKHARSATKRSPARSKRVDEE